MTIKILLLMILCHIIDDFVLQPVCLSKLKVKTFWESLDNWGLKRDLYENDYIMALFVHAASWSIMIHLPLIFLANIDGAPLLFSFIVNMLVHAAVDNLKANKESINLVQDQLYHFAQILVTYNLFYIFAV